MSFNTEALEPLFDLSREAVLGVENHIIRYANPAATALFGVRAGDSAEGVFSDDVLSHPAERYVASLERAGMTIELAALRQGTRLLIRAICPEKAGGIPRSLERALLEFGSSLAAAQKSVEDILASGTADQKSEDAAILAKSFYRLRRLHRHLTLADCIASDALPCQLRPTDLNRLIRDLCRSVEALVTSLGYEIRFLESEESCHVMADAGLMETLLLNLITNSLLRSEAGQVICVSLRTAGDHCLLSVEDAGEGMDAAKLSTALSGGVSASLTDIKAGASLGLYIAGGIARAHGGTLLLESREGSGTGVRISIPRMRSEGLEFFSPPGDYRHMDGMNPILTELSVFLDRRFYRKELLD